MADPGCGRIGRMHARNIAASRRMSLAMVYDLHSDGFRCVDIAVARRVVADPAKGLLSSCVDTNIDSTATLTHDGYLELAANACKTVQHEKPIDLYLQRVNDCGVRISKMSVPVRIGFNRRFDPGRRAAHDAVQRGEIGDLHRVVITSRDPETPSRANHSVAAFLALKGHQSALVEEIA